MCIAVNLEVLGVLKVKMFGGWLEVEGEENEEGVWGVVRRKEKKAKKMFSPAERKCAFWLRRDIQFCFIEIM